MKVISFVHLNNRGICYSQKDIYVKICKKALVLAINTLTEHNQYYNYL